MPSLYTTVQNVRDLTGLSSLDVSDAIISGIIQHVTTQLNYDIQLDWNNEPVRYISNEKENTIDNSNKKFYTRHFPIGDRDNNGVISGADVYVYTIDSLGNRAQIMVSGITTSGTIKASELGGPLWLAEAPSANVSMFFCYFSSPVDMETPHPLITLACSQLAAALVFTRIDASKVQSWRVGKIAVMKQSEAFKIYKMQYYDTINRIRQEMFKIGVGTKTL